jgi:hypothetical protein
MISEITPDRNEAKELCARLHGVMGEVPLSGVVIETECGEFEVG